MDMDIDETKISSDNKPRNQLSILKFLEWWVKIQNWNNMSWWLVIDTGLGTNHRRKQKKAKKA